jgi:two-component system LytT family response regulator
MIKTLIIDDEPLATEIVQEYLSSYPEFVVVKICHDGFAGMKAIQEYVPDLIFLDIQMPKITGFELLELLESPPAVIFTTAFDEFAIKAFDTHALDYLLKPFSKERFVKAISKYRQMDGPKTLQEPNEGLSQLQGQITRIVLKVKNEIKIIPFQDVKYLEANDDYVNIYTGEGKFLKNKTLISFEKVLDPVAFVRVHRSYIVKVGEITKIEPYEKYSYILKLLTGETIPVSRTGLTKLKAILGF